MLPREKGFPDEIEFSYLVEFMGEWFLKHDFDWKVYRWMYANRQYSKELMFAVPQAIFMQEDGPYNQLKAQDDKVVISVTTALQAMQDAYKRIIGEG